MVVILSGACASAQDPPERLRPRGDNPPRTLTVLPPEPTPDAARRAGRIPRPPFEDQELGFPIWPALPERHSDRRGRAFDELSTISSGDILIRPEEGALGPWATGFVASEDVGARLHLDLEATPGAYALFLHRGVTPCVELISVHAPDQPPGPTIDFPELEAQLEPLGTVRVGEDGRGAFDTLLPEHVVPEGVVNLADHALVLYGPIRAGDRLWNMSPSGCGIVEVRVGDPWVWAEGR